MQRTSPPAHCVSCARPLHNRKQPPTGPHDSAGHHGRGLCTTCHSAARRRVQRKRITELPAAEQKALRLAALERHRAGRAASTATLLRRSAVRKARIVEDFREIIEITGGTRSAHPSSIIGYDRPTVCRVAARLHMHPDTMGRIVRAAIKAEATA